MRDREGWTCPRFALFLAAVLVLSFAPILVGGQSLYFRDFGIFGYPFAYYHKECFWRGEIPLWNPYNCLGIPFLAQWATMVLYPGSLLYLFLPLPWSLNFFCLVHLWLAGLGMYRLTRDWTRDDFAATVAGTLFALNGVALSSLKWPHATAVLAWMPWVIWAVEKAWREGGLWVVLGAGAGAAQMLAGTPELIAETWVAVFIFWMSALMEAWRKGRKGLESPCSAEPRVIFRRLVVVVILVSALCAAQLLPFLDLLASSHRDAKFGMDSWAMPWWGWANFLMPLFRCFSSYQGVFAQYDQYWLSSYYLSLPGLLLAIWAVRLARRRRGIVMLLAALAVSGLILALGTHGPAYGPLLKLFPPLGFMRFPIKFVILVTFAAPAMAGFTVAAARTLGPAERQRFLRVFAWSAFGVLVAIGCLVVIGRIAPLAHDDWGAAWKNAAGRATFLVVGTVALLAALSPSRRLSKAGAIAFLAALCLDTLSHAPWQNPTVPRWALEPGLAELQPKPKLGGSRAMLSPMAEWQLDHWMPRDPATDYTASRLGLFANCNLLDKIPKVDGFYPLYLRTTAQLLNRLGSTNHDYPPLAQFLGVSQVTAPGKMTDWSVRTNALPLITIGEKPSFADEESQVKRLTATDFHPQAVVYLPLEARAEVKVTETTAGSVEAVQWSAHRVQFQTRATGAAMVVVAQSHHRWWRARVNGKAVRLLPANVACQALEVPAGTNQVELLYQDTPFYLGAAISLTALAGCAAWGGAWLRRPRSKG